MRKLAILACTFVLATAAPSAKAFTISLTDWTLIDTAANLASGTLGDVMVTFSGSDIDYGVTDGSFTGFNSSVFTPPLAASDVVSFRGAPAVYNYVLTFSDPLVDPILDLYSLASVLTFSTSNITRLSGDPDFLVSGNIVSGVLGTPGYNANGTVRLDGSFNSIAFTASYFDPREDGIGMQLGAPTAAPVPIPAALPIIAVAFGGFGFAGCRQRRKPA